MYPGYYNQYPRQETEFIDNDEFGGRNRFYENHPQQGTMAQQQKISISHQYFGNDLDNYEHPKTYFSLHSSNNIYQESGYPSIEPQKYVPIHVFESMICHYQLALNIIKSQNDILVKNIKNQMEKMAELHQFTQKLLAFSSNQQKDQHHSDEFNDQESFLVNQTVEKAQKLKQMNPNNPQANTFGIRRYIDNFHNKNH